MFIIDDVAVGLAITGTAVCARGGVHAYRRRRARKRAEVQAHSPEQIEYDRQVAERDRIITMRELHERTNEMEKGLDIVLTVWDDPPIPAMPVLQGNARDREIAQKVQAGWEMEHRLQKARKESAKAKEKAERTEHEKFLAEMPRCANCGTSAAEHHAVNPRGWKTSCGYQAASAFSPKSPGVSAVYEGPMRPSTPPASGAFGSSYSASADHMRFMDSLNDMVAQGFITGREAELQLKQSVPLQGGGEYRVWDNGNGTKTIDFYMVPGARGFAPAPGWKVIDKVYETYSDDVYGKHIRYTIARDEPLYTESIIEPEMPEIHITGEARPIAGRPATLITLPYPMTAAEAEAYKAEYLRRANNVGPPMIMPSSAVVTDRFNPMGTTFALSEKAKQTLDDASQKAHEFVTKKMAK